MIDPTTAFGERVMRRLESEVIIWLTTVRADGAPLPSPVWFLWQAGTVLIYSKPDTPKLRNIAQRPLVALNFDGNGRGGDIIVLSGSAQIDASTPPADQHPAYLDKYHSRIAGIGMTPERFAAAYSVAVRVTPTRLRGQ
jgi:PPOX class probable F420-dependent enzyme